MKRSLIAGAIGAIMLLAVAGGLAFMALREAPTRTVTVFAAASLTNAFEEIAEGFEAANEGVNVVFSFAGSSDLAAQLISGAPADVFASANNTQMTVAVEGGHITDSPQTFARNQLVLIVPADNPAGITSLQDLAKEDVKLIVAAPSVPVREYTDLMLEQIAADPAYGPQYRDAFMANVVSEEQNVRQVSAKIALGEADAGIVYRSDVTPDLNEQVIAFPIPDELNTIASYPIAVVTDSAAPELARAFVDYVLSDEGQGILQRWNFVPAKTP